MDELDAGSTVTIDVTVWVDVEENDNAVEKLLVLLSVTGDARTLAAEVSNGTAVTVWVTGIKTVLTVVALHADALEAKSK